MEGANVFVIADKDEIPEPRSVHSREYELHYLGEFTIDIRE
jgi:hypothetical protein